MVHVPDKHLAAIFRPIRDRCGVTLVELIVAMGIFATAIVGLYTVYDRLLQHQSKEYRLSESEMEMGIAKSLIERDLIMAGYGIMDDYSGYSAAAVKTVSAADGGSNPDILTLRGTALGIGSQAAQKWTSVADVVAGTPSFSVSDDVRENLQTGDRIIITNPSGGTDAKTKTLLTQGASWLFSYVSPTSNPVSVPAGVAYTSLHPGYLLYALNVPGETDASIPYYTVQYSLGSMASSTNPYNCAPQTGSLLRAESRTSTTPGSGDPVMSCVLDFQVAFGITDSTASFDPTLAVNFPINRWDSGAVSAAYSPRELNQRLKQIRVYILIQEGNKDMTYTYVNPDPNAAAPDRIRVGELDLVGGATGRDVQLTSAQRNYRWRVVTIVVTPRNIRAN